MSGPRDSAIRSHVSACARHSSADMGMMAYRASAKWAAFQDHDRSMLRRALLCASMLRLIATCSAICDMLALAAIQRCSEAWIRSEIRDSKILMEFGHCASPPAWGGSARVPHDWAGTPSLSAASARCPLLTMLTPYAPFEGSSRSPRRLSGSSEVWHPHVMPEASLPNTYHSVKSYALWLDFGCI